MSKQNTSDNIREMEIEVRNAYIKIYLILGFSVAFIITGTIWYGAAMNDFGRNAGMVGVIFGVIGMIISVSFLCLMKSATMESPQ